MRKAFFAGKFYPAVAAELKKTIKNLSAGLELPASHKKIIAAVSPHAGYEYSGRASAESYLAIAESWKKEKAKPGMIVILGVNHTGYATSAFSLSLEDFETPLGIAKNDSDFGKKLLKAAENEEFNLKIDERAHLAEHSIEVQIPFIQSFFSNCKIVPILINNADPEACEELADLIFDLVEETGKKAVIVASGDFTHFGYIYGFMPFTSDVKRNLYALDGKAIKNIIGFNVNGFLKMAQKTTICGVGPVLVAMEYARKSHSHEAKLLDYYTSADIEKGENYRNAVGYAAIVFY
jgi:AmmeMemoRadiSam system protein B